MSRPTGSLQIDPSGSTRQLRPQELQFRQGVAIPPISPIAQPINTNQPKKRHKKNKLGFNQGPFIQEDQTIYAANKNLTIPNKNTRNQNNKQQAILNQDANSNTIPIALNKVQKKVVQNPQSVKTLQIVQKTESISQPSTIITAPIITVKQSGNLVGNGPVPISHQTYQPNAAETNILSNAAMTLAVPTLNISPPPANSLQQTPASFFLPLAPINTTVVPAVPAILPTHPSKNLAVVPQVVPANNPTVLRVPGEAVQPALSSSLAPPPPQSQIKAASLPPNEVKKYGKDRILSENCQFCGSNAPVREKKVYGEAFMGWTILFCMLGCVLAWVPYCYDPCYDKQITCSNCKRKRNYIKSKWGCSF